MSVPQTLNPFFTDTCGFPVYHNSSGYRNTTLFYDAKGVLVHQIDVYPQLSWWLSAPEFNTMWSWDPSALITESTYPAGAEIGAPVTVKLSGIQGRNQGFQPDAGLRIYSGHVAGYDGIVPLWDGTYSAELLKMVGVWGSNDPSLNAAVCAGLSGS